MWWDTYWKLKREQKNWTARIQEIKRRETEIAEERKREITEIVHIYSYTISFNVFYIISNNMLYTFIYEYYVCTYR